MWARLETKSCAGWGVESEVDLAASHFYELDLEDLKRVDFCIVEGMVSSPLLRLNTEDSLLDFIWSVDCDREVLFRYLHFEYLSHGRIADVLEALWPADIDPLTWSSLCRQLLLPKEICMNEDNSLDGIISYLTKKHGGNVHEKGIVTITSKSVRNDDPKYALKNVADLPFDSRFYSKNEPGQWLCWDFREMRVRPTHCTIGTAYLKSWVLDGSLDGKSWTEIDQGWDDEFFKRWGTGSFTISKPAECRFIRLTQTENRKRNDSLILFAVEFFGTLSE
jgi:hypothetical protein